MTEYPLSSTCTGYNVPDQMTVDQCLQDEDGTYFENFCTLGASKMRSTGVKKVKKIVKQ